MHGGPRLFISFVSESKNILYFKVRKGLNLNLLLGSDIPKLVFHRGSAVETLGGLMDPRAEKLKKRNCGAF